MRVHVYAVCWNEQDFLPYYLRYYSKFAERIVVYDNQSSDATPELVRACPKAELRTYDTGGVFEDPENLRIKNSAYKESRGQADFVIVGDVDEILYHPQLEELLKHYKREGITLPKTRGIDMVAWRFPRSPKQVVEAAQIGCESPYYAKRSLFDPSLDINYGLGCHTCKPEGRVVESQQADLRMLHYHYLGLQRCISRHRIVRRRLAASTQGTKVAYQFRWGPGRIAGRFLAYQAGGVNVMTGRKSSLNALLGPAINGLKSLYWKSRERGK